jgi:four helix bundle protein
MTDSFPDSQKFSLASQVQRSSVSITSNLAEGFARRGKNEKIQFYHLALGSLTELQSQLLVARDLGYCSEEVSRKIANQTVFVSKLLNGLVKSAKEKKILNT